MIAIAIAATLMLAATPAAPAPLTLTEGERCGHSADCGYGLFCASGACRPACDSNADCRAGDCTPTEAGYSVCWTGAKTGPQKKPTSSWSKQGWQKLRFGMGPGDVLSAVDTPCDPVRGTGEEAAECTGWPEKVAGVEPAVKLKYYDGELFQIEIHLSSPPTDIAETGSAILRERWRDNLRAAMIAKYGAPASEDGVVKTKRGARLRDFYFGGWRIGSLSVSLGLGGDSALITYADAARVERAATAAAKAIEQKAKVDPAGL